MTTLTITADCNGTLVPNYSSFMATDISPHVRDASFRSNVHHKVNDPKLLLKLPESMPTTPSRLFSPFLPSRKPKGNEIAVFDAEKYFKGEDEASQRLGIQSPRVYRSMTPSMCSESSANSQLALLRSRPTRTDPQPESKHKTGRRIVLVGCPCSGKKSVRTDAVTFQESRRPIFDIRTGYSDSLSKRVILGVSDPADRILKLPQELFLRSGRFERAKESIFNPASTTNWPHKINNISVGGSNNTQKLQHASQLDIFDDVGGRISESGRLASRCIDICTPGSRVHDELDAASDASSDLFELDVISSQVGSYLRRTVSGDMSSCYEPSEASIEWSVATASNAEFSESGSLVSCHASKGRALGLPMPEGGTQKRRPSLLSGCRSQDAVNVATNSLTKPPADNHLEPSQMSRRFHSKSLHTYVSPSKVCEP